MPWLIPIGIAAAGAAAGAGASGAAAGINSATSPDSYNQTGANWAANTGPTTPGKVWVESPLPWESGHWEDVNRPNNDGYDPNAFEYGGSRTAGDRIGSEYAGMGKDAQAREAFLANYTDVNVANARGRESRAEQMQGLGLARDAAMGLAPSVAQQQMRQGLDQAMRGQESMRASARGAGGIALADYNAAGNIAAQQQQVTNQMGILRADEMARARGEYMQGAGAMRQGDALSAQQAAAMAEFQAKQQAGNRAQNDQFSQGMFGLAEGVRGSQLNAQGKRQGILQAGYSDAEHLKAGASAQAAGEHSDTRDFVLRVGTAVANGVNGGASAGGGGPSPGAKK